MPGSSGGGRGAGGPASWVLSSEGAGGPHAWVLGSGGAGGLGARMPVTLGGGGRQGSSRVLQRELGGVGGE